MRGAEPAKELRKLTEVAQVLRLSKAEAERQYPVQFQATVTYVDASWGILFVQDATAGIFVDRLPPPLPKPGDLLAIQAATAPGLYSPVLVRAAADFVQRVRLPTPRSIEIAELNMGMVDSQYVEISGVIQTDEDMGDRRLLGIGSGLNRCRAWVLQEASERGRPLIGARVRIRGVGGADFGGGRRVKGFHLYVSGLNEITVVEPASGDPFALPAVASDQLNAFVPFVSAEHRVHVHGAVTMHWPGHLLFVNDERGGICFPNPKAPGIGVGDQVDAVGFRVAASLAPLLEGGVVRCAGPGARVTPVPPVSIIATQAFQPEFRYRLVQTEVRLLERSWTAHEKGCLLLQTDTESFTAFLPGTNAANALVGLEPGSRLRLTGVCDLLDSASRPSPELILWLRSPADVQVISGPPRQNETLVLWVAGLLAVTLLGAAIPMTWIRRRARQQVEQSLEESKRDLRRHIEDRERISQDLHDNVMQSIYAVGLGLEDCRRIVQKSPVEAEERLGIAVRALNSVIKDVRQFIGGLEPKVLSGSEIKTALKSLALTAGESSSQFIIQVDPNATRHLTSHEATHLLNIAKEAMSNTLRHAKATRTLVALQLAQDHVRLEIADDGVGFDTHAPNHLGNGLRNVAARARELRARVEIVSKQAGGTRILIDLPPLPHYDNRLITDNSA